MDVQNTWDALLRPGVADAYFDVYGQRAFRADATAYSAINAWWLAELSRLIYRRDRDEVGNAAQTPTRNEILKEVGLQEIAFFNQGGTQCAVVGPVLRAHGDWIVLVFRGTDNLQAWIDNLNALPGPWPGGGSVHQGFREALERVWEMAARRLSGVEGARFYTGHSLGGALASLAASKRPPTALYTFGSPRVGDQAFGATLAGRPAFRVVNDRDVVPTLPPPLFGYRHVGEVHHIGDQERLAGDPPDRPAETLLSNIVATWTDRQVAPPQFLADHAPVNYVARLEHEVSREGL